MTESGRLLAQGALAAWLALAAGGCVSAAHGGDSGAGPGAPGTPLAASAPASAAAARVAAAASPEAAPRPGAPGYYVEFRSRPFALSGHSYMAYGPLDRAGEPAEENLVGLFPTGGALGVAAGSMPLPVPASLEPQPGDRDLPVRKRWRAKLSAAQYDRLLAFVAREKAKQKMWNLWGSNCNEFAGELAQSVGLKAPTVSVVPTDAYVEELRTLNEGSAGQGAAGAASRSSL